MSADTNIEKSYSELPLLKSVWFWVTLIGLVLILGGWWIVFSRTLVGSYGAVDGEAIVLESAPVAGHPAPDFELVSVDGDVVHLSDFKGTPVILNFWATWCGPCRAEFPDFQRASVDNAGRLVIIGVNHTSADQADRVPDFLNDFGITFPILLDEDGEVVETYRILGLPTTIFIDSNGVVNEVFTGPINQAYIESKISELYSAL
jgi:peroxiredoxin